MGKKKFIIGGIILFLAIGYLGWLGFVNSATYYYEVGEFLGKSELYQGQSVRVNGTVVPGSIQQAEGGSISFAIRDTKVSSTTMTVVYTGAVPDTLQEDNDVVVEGKYTEEGIFEATALLTKCASKYEPALE